MGDGLDDGFEREVAERRARLARATGWALALLGAVVFVLTRDAEHGWASRALQGGMWAGCAIAVYLGYRPLGRDARGPVVLATLVGALIGAGWTRGVDVGVLAFAAVALVVAASQVALRAGAAAPDPGGASDERPDHPLATARMLDEHAARLREEGRTKEAAKIEARARVIRERHGDPAPA